MKRLQDCIQNYLDTVAANRNEINSLYLNEMITRPSSHRHVKIRELKDHLTRLKKLRKMPVVVMFED